MSILNKKPEFVAATCPKCGGVLELDSNFEVAYCSNCKTQLDEKLIAKSEQLTISTEEHINSKATILTDINCNLTEPFEKTIDIIKKIYSGKCGIAFDDENIYLDI